MSLKPQTPFHGAELCGSRSDGGKSTDNFSPHSPDQVATTTLLLPYKTAHNSDTTILCPRLWHTSTLLFHGHFHTNGICMGTWCILLPCGSKDFVCNQFNTLLSIIQICSGITCGRVFNGELYAQKLQKLIYLHLSSDCFMKISLHSSGLHETNNLQTNADTLTSVISVYYFLYILVNDLVFDS